MKVMVGGEEREGGKCVDTPSCRLEGRGTGKKDVEEDSTMIDGSRLLIWE